MNTKKQNIDLLLLVLVKIIHELSHLLDGKPLRIEGEYGSSIHVVDVGPHRLKRYTSFAVVIDNFCYLKHISISVSTLVELYSF